VAKRVDEKKEIKNLLEIYHQKIKNNNIYSLGMSALEEAFDGGLDGGRVVMVGGEYGKAFLEQIMFHTALFAKCLYFALGFNKRQFMEHVLKRSIDHYLSNEQMQSILAITGDLHSCRVGDVISSIREQVKKHKIEVIAIDELLFLYESSEEFKGESIKDKRLIMLRRLISIAKELDLLFLVASNHEDFKKAALLVCDVAMEVDVVDSNAEIYVLKNSVNEMKFSFKMSFNRDVLMFKEIEDSQKDDYNPALDIVVVEDEEDEMMVDELKKKGVIFEE